MPPWVFFVPFLPAELDSPSVDDALHRLAVAGGPPVVQDKTRITVGDGLRPPSVDDAPRQLHLVVPLMQFLGVWILECRRLGIGRVRHLAVGQLWIQELVQDEVLDLYKVKGEENPADLLTKPLGRVVLDGHLGRLQLRRMTGRAASAPAASTDVDTSLAAAAPRWLREGFDDEEAHPRWADLLED